MEDTRNPYSVGDNDQAMPVYALRPNALDNTLKSVRYAKGVKLRLSQRLIISSPQPIKYLTQSIKKPAYPAEAQIRCNFGNMWKILSNTSFAPSRGKNRDTWGVNAMEGNRYTPSSSIAYPKPRSMIW